MFSSVLAVLLRPDPPLFIVAGSRCTVLCHVAIENLTWWASRVRKTIAKLSQNHRHVLCPGTFSDRKGSFLRRKLSQNHRHVLCPGTFSDRKGSFLRRKLWMCHCSALPDLEQLYYHYKRLSCSLCSGSKSGQALLMLAQTGFHFSPGHINWLLFLEEKTVAVPWCHQAFNSQTSCLALAATVPCLIWNNSIIITKGFLAHCAVDPNQAKHCWCWRKLVFTQTHWLPFPEENTVAVPRCHFKLTKELLRIRLNSVLPDLELNYHYYKRLSCSLCSGSKSGRALSQALSQGVPQGSVMGPILFTMYTSPLESIIDQHGVNKMFYADDTQLSVAFKRTNLYDVSLKISECMKTVKEWSRVNGL